jgi:hypothetical protein
MLTSGAFSIKGPNWFRVCRGRVFRSACGLTSALASWWGVEGGHTRAPGTREVFRWEVDAPSCTHTPCTTTLHSCLSPLSPYTPLSHHPIAASAPSSSTAGAHPVQAVGATVPPSAEHTG